MNESYKFEIPGRVGIKKNSKRIIVSYAQRAGRRIKMLSSERYSAFEKHAILTLAKIWGDKPALTGRIEAVYKFYFKNRQGEADTSNCIEGPQDCLESAGIILNDKQIIRLYAEKIFDGTEKTIIELKQVNE